MPSYYSVPDQYNGKSLFQINAEGKNGVGYNPDDFARYLGIGANTPLTSGQNLAYNGGVNQGDTNMISRMFGPGKSPDQELADKQKADLQTEVNNESSQVSGFTDAFGKAVPQIINSTSAKYNLPMLGSLVQGLNSRISELSGNTSNNGAGGFATGDQVDKALNTNYIPRFNSAVSNLNTGTALAQGETNQLLTPWTTKATMLNDQLARNMTGFTSTQQNALQALLAKMNNDVTLTKTEMDNANALAVAKLNYDATIKGIEAQTGSASYKYLSVPPANTVINNSGKSVFTPSNNFSVSNPGTTGNATPTTVYNASGVVNSAPSNSIYDPNAYANWIGSNNGFSGVSSDFWNNATVG